MRQATIFLAQGFYCFESDGFCVGMIYRDPVGGGEIDTQSSPSLNQSHGGSKTN